MTNSPARDNEALIGSETLYHTLFEAANDGVFLLSLNPDGSAGTFVAVNGVARRRLGYTAEEFAQMRPTDIDPEWKDKCLKVVDLLRRQGHGTFETIHQAKDGRRIPVEISSRLLVIGGRPFGLSIARDITERKQAEAEILRYQAQLEAIYNNTPVMMCLLNERGEVERMNRSMAELATRPLSENDSRKPGDLLGCLNALDGSEGCGARPNCRACPLHRALLETLRTGQPQRRLETTIILARGGARREIRVSASTALVRIGEESRLLLCLEDITEQKQLEQQFQQLQKMEAVGQLAGGIAHDFNNILAAIIMHLDLLQQNKSLEPAITDALKEVQSYAQRAADLTRQLLLFSRRKTAFVRRLDVNLVLENMIQMLPRLLGESIEMRFCPAEEDQWVDADHGMLEQVVMNLCLNARDAMPNGGTLMITTETVDITPQQSGLQGESREGRFVCLTVGDTGCGMDAATTKRIFEPFFTTKEVGKGTGLGLAAVYGIVRQHQGWVSVESTLGKGTTVQVFLPRAEAPQTIAIERETPIARGQEIILLVEDEPSVLRITAKVLRGIGYRVLEAHNGLEGLRAWTNAGGQVQLVFTDMVMPGGMSGLELIRRLRCSHPGLKAILASGYSQELTDQGKEALPNVRCIVKPYEAASIATVVREVLDEE